MEIKELQDLGFLFSSSFVVVGFGREVGRKLVFCIAISSNCVYHLCTSTRSRPGNSIVASTVVQT